MAFDAPYTRRLTCSAGPSGCSIISSHELPFSPFRVANRPSVVLAAAWAPQTALRAHDGRGFTFVPVARLLRGVSGLRAADQLFGSSGDGVPPRSAIAIGAAARIYSAC